MAKGRLYQTSMMLGMLQKVPEKSITNREYTTVNKGTNSRTCVEILSPTLSLFCDFDQVT